ncbi:MAG TPA: TonB-dependent receptor [Thermoanaerobaculia bacterium]|nr:TonB-dependent receptor [Thermoanaerobaculia bacterium]
MAAALLAAAAPVGAASPPYEGRPLAEALLSLQRQGLTIVFTSELVRPEMKVIGEPASREPRQILDEILEPHGLDVEEGPGGVLVVVAKRGSRQASSIEGRVLARESQRGVTGAVVRVIELGFMAAVQDDGSFSLAVLEPGIYTLEASAAGYLEERIAGVPVAAGEPRRIVFHLRRQPVFHEEIVVQPSRLELLKEPEATSGPAESFSLDREEIESLPHLGGDFFRTTSLLPGVAAGDVTAQFSVHGGRRDEVRILLDGQELYDAFHLKDYDNALSVVPARALGGATLTTGAYPASQGDRMSGVLDLRTVEPPAGRQYVLGVSVLDATASSSGRFGGDRGAWLFTGRRGSLQLAREAIGNEDPRFWDVLGKAELTTHLGLIGARVLAAGDELELDKADEESFDRFENRYRSNYGWLTHQAAPGRRLVVETAASWAGVHRRRGGAGGDEEGSFELRDRRDLEVLALAQTWSSELAPRHAFLGGWEARHYDAFFDYGKALEPELVIAAPFAPPRLTVHAFEGTLRGDHVGLWASDLISWRELTAELGLRYDRHSATDDDVVSPRVSLAWRWGERSLVRAAWGKFFQSQRPYELQVEDGESRLRPAELSRHWVVGLERLLPSNRLGFDAVRIELFRRDIDDPRPRYENLLEPLNFFPEVEPDRVLVAPERSTADGLELLLRGSRGPRFGWWLAYSYARSEDRLAGKTVPRAFDQPHTLALDLNFRPAGPWSLNLAWRYHTGWPTTPVEARLVGDPEDPDDEPDDEPEEKAELEAVYGPLRSERLPPYHRLDLRASRRWDLRQGRLTFFVDIQNLYNRRNLAGFDVHLDEDAGKVELEGERWPGAFPSFGVTWEF